MPVLMTVCAIAPIGYALHYSGSNEQERFVRWAAAAFFVAALVSTIVFNVPINRATGKWDVENLPEDWKKIRDRWERFQGIRS